MMVWYILFGCVAAALALLLYVRLAPTKAQEWHGVALPVGRAGSSTGEGSHTVIIENENAAAHFRGLDQIIRATPHTSRLAGSLDEGRITYITRSRVCGFPDYTTMALNADKNTVTLHGRLRFGKSDLGVNRARIEGWLGARDRDRPTP